VPGKMSDNMSPDRKMVCGASTNKGGTALIRFSCPWMWKEKKRKTPTNGKDDRGKNNSKRQLNKPARSMTRSVSCARRVCGEIGAKYHEKKRGLIK